MAKRKANAEDNKETSSSSSSSTSEVKVKIEQIDQLERTGGSDKPVDVLDSSPSPEELAQVAKKARTALSTNIANKSYFCPILHCIMVDPVIAADGITYEKTAAVEWLKDHDTSPINPGMKISVDILIENIVLRNQIEDFVASPECPEDMKEEYEEKKNRGKKLFKEGKVLEAANLGYLEAMGKMAMNYGLGEGGFNVDKDKAFEFATKAANAGDKGGQFQLARCYHLVIGVQQDNAAALTWYQRCIEKGCGLGAVNNNMGKIYYIGGHGVEKNFTKAVEYFRIAAD